MSCFYFICCGGRAWVSSLHGTDLCFLFFLIGDLQSSLPQEIMAALNKQGILKLYSHQADALDALHNKHHVIVTTCTARQGYNVSPQLISFFYSGKSLIYQLPVLKSLLENRSNKAMFLFPTKALAQDQLRSFQNLLSLCPSLSTVNVATFDGDTPLHQRRKIREEVDVLFTNPDMLHYAILPNASYWQGFLVGLCYSVIDEIHVYHGTLGAHVALVLRRLRRLCDRLGNTSVLFVSCSATIKHPEKHMKELLGVDSVQRIDQDGSPCGNKQFILWNPPLLSNTPQQVRKSAVTECASMLEYFLSCDIRTIVFCKTRKTCELLMKQMRDNVEQKQCQGQHHGQEKLKKVMSYRGGYTPHDRRRIEKQLFCGKLLCVIATNALELGIDIGSLDAVIMLGVPWSAAAMWQQSGRAGRQHTDSLSMVIAEDNPIDQYYMNNPSEFFEKKAEDLQLPIEDFAILASHLQCAAEELPIDIARDKEYFGDKLHSICQESLVSISNDQSLYRPHPRFRPYPSQFIQLRNITQETFAVVDVTDRRNVIIEEVETHRAPFEIYNGAIFIHQGLTYLVDECNVVQRYAKVHLVQVDWTTRQQDYTNVNTMSAIQSTSVHSTRNTVSYGKAQVETVVFGYHKINKQNKIIDTLEVFMDPVLMDVMAIWVDVPTPALDELAVLEIDIMAAIHSTAHALSNSLPQVLFSAADTLKTECKNPYATRKRPTKIILYESQSKSTVQKVYYNFDTFVQAAIKRVEDCSCELGCPTCIHLLTCSERNLFHSKKGAHIILKAIVGKDRHTE
ncbi:P-loop containing nucleoside triphosphate hydrolase protein [Spinellus fusiger]|nr:P-loop containing nucleoside triphosphate hydrolase protein [Spinellus fusiger]